MECRKQLIDSYKIKKNIMKLNRNSVFCSEILQNVNRFLHTSRNFDNLSVMEFNETCLAIVPSSERMYMELQGWRRLNGGLDPSVNAFHALGEHIDIKEERLVEPEVLESYFNPYDDEENQDYEENLEFEDTMTFKGPDKRRNRSPRWLSEALHESKHIIQTPEGPTEVWTCALCKNVTTYTYSGMRVHLTKFHDHEKDSVKVSQLKVVKSETLNFKAAKSISKYDKSNEWISEMVEKSREGEMDIWKCCICEKISSISRFGMQLHITRMHCQKLQNLPTNEMIEETVDENENQTVEPESNEFSSHDESSSDEMEETERHERDPEWIREMIEESRTREGSTDLFKCCICNDVTSQSYRGIQLHIIRMHCKKNKISWGGFAKDENSDKHERDPAWINEMIESSQMKDGLTDMWTCCLCENVTTKSVLGIRLHIMRMHCVQPLETQNAGDFLKSDDDMSVSSDDQDKDYVKNSVVKSGKRALERVNDALEKSRVTTDDGEELWTCAICKKVTSKSYKGMKLHIVRMHKKDLKSARKSAAFSPKTSPSKKSASFEEINERVERCKQVLFIDGSHSEIWTCHECDGKVFKSESAIRGHIMLNHSASEDRKSSDEGGKLNKFQKNQLKMEIQKCRVINGDVTSYKCESCAMNFKSFTGIHYHLSTKHFNFKQSTIAKAKNENLPEIEGLRGKCLKPSEMTEEERQWLRDMVKVSRVKKSEQNTWSCCLCNKVYNYYGVIRYHIVTVHMPHWQLGPDAYNDHMEQCKKVVKAKEGDNKKGEETPDYDEVEVTADNMFESMKLETTRGSFMKASEMNDEERLWLRQNVKKSRMRTASKDSWECWICHRSYGANSMMRYHMIVTHMPPWKLGEGIFKKHIDACKKAVALGELRTRKKPLGISMQNCKLCNVRFHKLNEYQNHVQMHSITEPLAMQMVFSKCELCPTVYRARDDLVLHVMRHDSDEVFISIPSPGLLGYNSVTTGKNFWCGHCSNKYEEEVDINRHIMLHHMNPIICPFDRQEFTQIQPLLAHISTSHSEVSSLGASCSHCQLDNCDKAEHIKVSNEKPLECDHCDQRFDSKQRLLSHLKIAFGINDFSCDICGESFVSRPDLLTHMTSHSPNVNLK